jgi:voltage-gated potassium channel
MFEMSEQRATPTTFDVFVLALSAFSLINIIWILILQNGHVRNVVLIVDPICSVVFLADFFLQLHRAPTKSSYFVKQWGWLDLVGSFPFPLFRIARIVRVFRIYQPLKRTGGKGVIRQANADRAGSALLIAIFLTIIVIQYASMSILWAEGKNAHGNIHTASDAVWWSYVTITTVGYGDRFPVTNLGRLVGVALLSSGVGLFAVITGFLANSFLSRRGPREPTVTPEQLDARLRQLEALGDAIRVASVDGSTPAAVEPSTEPPEGMAE